MTYGYLEKIIARGGYDAEELKDKLMDKDLLQGDEKGRLGLTMDMLKVFVINDRAGLYD